MISGLNKDFAVLSLVARLVPDFHVTRVRGPRLHRLGKRVGAGHDPRSRGGPLGPAIAAKLDPADRGPRVAAARRRGAGGGALAQLGGPPHRLGWRWRGRFGRPPAQE